MSASDAGAGQHGPPAGRRRQPRPWWRLARLLALLVASALLALLLVAWLLQPQRAGRLALEMAGDALGLELSAGRIDWRLRGTPQLVLDDVRAARPGTGDAILAARRVFIAVPWSTLRSRGRTLDVERIELDAPVLDLPALRRWLATRPPGPRPRLPVLEHGLRVRDGRLENGNWQLDAIAIDIVSLRAGEPLRARLRGHYPAASLKARADLAITVMRPQALLDGKTTGAALAGAVALAGASGWTLPTQLLFAGPLRAGGDGVSMQPLRAGVAGHYVEGDNRVPFRVGLAGPLAGSGPNWRLDPMALVTGGGDVIPTLQAAGQIHFENALQLGLAGAIARWPHGWPALPEALAQSASPMGLYVSYDGAPTLTDPTLLGLAQDGTRLGARFRLRDVMAWVAAAAAGKGPLLPPLDGVLVTPEVVMSGVTLEGVRVEIADSP